MKEMEIGMRISSAMIFFLIVSLATPAMARGQAMERHGMMGQEMYEEGPYGNYCPGMRWGPYGVRKPVGTVEEAKLVMETYLSGGTDGIHVGKIREKNLYFEAEILNRDGKLIDKAIIDKRTGRIRSIY